MSEDTTDPALLPNADDTTEELPFASCGGGGDDGGDGGGGTKERHSLTLGQRRALRRWANSQVVRPSHKACIDWFLAQYGQQISQSTVSHSLSPKYSRLDGENPQLSGSRLRFGNWPDVEKLVLLWYQQVQASGRHPTNEELADKAKAIFHQLPRYRDEVVPEFSPGWIHRFKKRYGLLVRRQRRHTDGPGGNGGGGGGPGSGGGGSGGAGGAGGAGDPAQDIEYLADCIPRFIAVAPDTSPAAVREQILRVVGVEASLGICALVRDEILRRLAASQQQPQHQHQQHQHSHHHHTEQVPPEMAMPSPEADDMPSPSPHSPPPPQQQQQQPPQPEHNIYTEDDPEMVLQNALRQLQEEEQAAEEHAAAVRVERERAERAGLPPPPPPPLVADAGRSTQHHGHHHHARYETPAQDMTSELALTPMNSEEPMPHHDGAMRCPFCINQRLLRSIKEAIDHMSTHVVV